jgi:pyridoxamine 5'-phosphate oxidase-like protein
MTIPDDVAAFLGRHTRAFLLTRRRDGSPTIHPMTAFFADGRVTMTTYRKSAKARNVERDDRAACLIVNGYAKNDVRAVLVRGRGRLRQATIEALPAAAREEPPSIAGASHPKVSGDVTARVAARMASGKRVFLDVEPDRVDGVQALGTD